MRTAWITVAIAAALTVSAAPATAQGSYRTYGGDSEFRFRVGTFEPDGESEYWDDTFFDFTGSTESFEDTIAGVDYVHRLGRRVGVMASINAFEADARQAYRDFVDADGRDIRHTTFFEVTSATLGLLFHLTGPEATLQPYLGGGGGFYSWTLEESGDFIDFAGGNEIFTDTFLAEGDAFGTYFVAGLSVPVGESFTLFAEGRWDSADDELADDFEGLGTLDLAGRQIAAGLSWRF